MLEWLCTRYVPILRTLTQTSDKIVSRTYRKAMTRTAKLELELVSARDTDWLNHWFFFLSGEIDVLKALNINSQMEGVKSVEGFAKETGEAYNFYGDIPMLEIPHKLLDRIRSLLLLTWRVILIANVKLSNVTVGTLFSVNSVSGGKRLSYLNPSSMTACVGSNYELENFLKNARNQKLKGCYDI